MAERAQSGDPSGQTTGASQVHLPGTGSRWTAWKPLRVPMFRNLLIADLVSDIGTFMQGVGAAWLMVSQGAGPLLVALTQTASALPFFLLALPAGALGDIFDRRKLIVTTEVWMVSVATAIAALTLLHWITPWMLLLLTVALSIGDALEAPTWRAILPEVVPREDLLPAIALNGIEFNLARAIGPALGGFLIGRGRGHSVYVKCAIFPGCAVGDCPMEAARTAERLASRNIERRDARGVSLHPKHTRNVDRPRTDRGDYVFRQPILGATPNRGSSTAGKRDVIRVAPDRFRRRRDAGSAGATTSAVIFFSGCCAGHGDHGFCRRFMGHGDVQVHRPVVHSHCVWRRGVDDSDVTDEHSDAERCARLGACARSSDLHAGVHGCVGGRKCILGLCGGAPRHALFLPGSGDWHSGVTSTDSNFAPAEHSGGSWGVGPLA